MSSSPPFKLFIIYAREDQSALLELKAHLRPLENRGDLTVWYDGEILPGEKWDDAIKAQLEAADIVLLFISKSFFNSEYIEKEELKKALKRHSKGETTVVPVIVKPCLWDAHPEISALQVLPKDGKAVSSWGDSDVAFLDVARGVQKIIEIKVAAYEEFLAKEQVKRAVNLYEDHIAHEAYSILSKHQLNPRLMTSAAYHALGEMLFYGEGGARQNYSEAFEYYLKAAQKKHRLSQIQVGKMYENGLGVAREIDTAVEWYTKAEKGGDPTAQYYLGSLYEDGDIDKAISWHEKSSDQGHLDSQKALKRLMQIKENSQKENEAIEAFDQGKHGYAFQVLTGYLQNNEAINPKVYHLMGSFYRLGTGGATRDFSEAMKWYLKAAEKKYANAYVNIGFMYERGEGVKSNNIEAVKWFRKAAWEGIKIAKESLIRLGYHE